MKVCKCPHIRHIISYINITYDVIFITPVCTRKSNKLIAYLSLLNEQVAYKRGVAGPKKMAIGINYCQNGRLAKAKVTLVFWTQALSHN